MTLHKNRYQTGTMSLTVCLDTRKGQQNNISQLPAQPFTPPSSSTTMTDNYNTNVAMVYNDESIDLIKPNKELPNFADIARDIQNRVSRCVGSELKEAWLFRKFFGTSMRDVKILWELIGRDKLRPRGGHPEHLLWALYFMKVYPKQGPGCSVVGASAGAVDPKTHRKWVRAYLKAIAKLVDVVVSLLYFFAFVY